MNPEAFKDHVLPAQKRINIVVFTVDGASFVSDTQTVLESDLDDVYEVLKDFSELTSFNITSDGGKVFFNPAHIIAVRVSVQASL